MKDINTFQELIRNTLEIAKNQGNKINTTQVIDIFKDMELNEMQRDQVFDYLAVNKINVIDYVKASKNIEPKKELDQEDTEEPTAFKKSINEDDAMDSAYLAQYLDELKYIRNCTDEELVNLINKVKTGDKLSKDRFIETHLQKVVEIACDYKNQGMKVEDLIQEGNMALLQSLMELPDTDNVDDIMNFIDAYVRDGIIAALEEQLESDKIENELMQRSNRIFHALKELEEELGRQANIHELAGFVNMTEEELYDILELSADAMSLNKDHNHNHDHINHKEDCQCNDHNHESHKEDCQCNDHNHGSHKEDCQCNDHNHGSHKNDCQCNDHDHKN